MERLDSQMAKLQKAERKVGHINSNYQQLGAEARKAYAEAEKALKKYQNAEAKAERRSSFVRQKAIVKDPNATEADIDAAVVNDGTFVNLSASAGEAHARYIELTAQAERLSQKHERHPSESPPRVGFRERGHECTPGRGQPNRLCTGSLQGGLLRNWTADWGDLPGWCR